MITKNFALQFEYIRSNGEFAILPTIIVTKEYVGMAFLIFYLTITWK